MEQNRMEKDKAKCAYVPPRIELFAAVEDRLLAGQSFGGGHGDGTSDDGGGDAGTGFGENDDLSGGLGAKAMILGQEFNFSDVWED